MDRNIVVIVIAIAVALVGCTGEGSPTDPFGDSSLPIQQIGQKMSCMPEVEDLSFTLDKVRPPVGGHCPLGQRCNVWYSATNNLGEELGLSIKKIDSMDAPIEQEAENSPLLSGGTRLRTGANPDKLLGTTAGQDECIAVVQIQAHWLSPAGGLRERITVCRAQINWRVGNAQCKFSAAAADATEEGGDDE